jgi:hypothetical protein
MGDDLGRIEHPDRGVERHICTGEAGIILKRLRDQRIGLMHLFDHVANLGARENSGPPSTRWMIAGASACPLRCFNLAINIRADVAAPAFHLNRWWGQKRFTFTAQAIDTYREEPRANCVNRH